MKIALVILHADPARGGAERYTIDLAETLASRGHDVALVAGSFAVEPPGVSKVPLDIEAFSRLGQYEAFLDALDRHVYDTHYDVVHAMLPVRRCHVYHPHAGIAAEAVASGHTKHRGLLAQAAARLFNQLSTKRRRFAQVEAELLSKPTLPVILCLSEYVKRTVQTHYPIDEERLPSLFNAVNLSRFDPDARPQAGNDLRGRLNIPDDAVIALTMAQDFERKGLREAIEALARVDEERLVLVVVGRPDPSAYKRLAKKLNVSQRVLFAGATKDPYAFYKAADFFVLPTRHDPCSLVVLEALAMGVPVISTSTNGATEVMSEGQEGFILDNPSDVQRLAAAMRALIDPARRLEMRAACLALRPRLSDEAHLERLLEIYQQVQTPGPAAE